MVFISAPREVVISFGALLRLPVAVGCGGKPKRKTKCGFSFIRMKCPKMPAHAKSETSAPTADGIIYANSSPLFSVWRSNVCFRSASSFCFSFDRSSIPSVVFPTIRGYVGRVVALFGGVHAPSADLSRSIRRFSPLLQHNTRSRRSNGERDLTAFLFPEKKIRTQDA